MRLSVDNRTENCGSLVALVICLCLALGGCAAKEGGQGTPRALLHVTGVVKNVDVTFEPEIEGTVGNSGYMSVFGSSSKVRYKARAVVQVTISTTEGRDMVLRRAEASERGREITETMKAGMTVEATILPEEKDAPLAYYDTLWIIE